MLATTLISQTVVQCTGEEGRKATGARIARCNSKRQEESHDCVREAREFCSRGGPHNRGKEEEEEEEAKGNRTEGVVSSLGSKAVVHAGFDLANYFLFWVLT
jgi:hypothetical protein